MRRALIAPMALTAALAAAPRAQYDDPPARVARVSYLAGEGSVRHGTTSDWMAFVINFPVTTGDELWTDEGARTELHIGSSALRLAGRTAVEVVILEDDRIVLRLTEGTLGLRVRSLDGDDRLRIETPAGSIDVKQPGAYRVSVDTLGGSALLVVRRGAVQVAYAGGPFDVLAGQAVVITGDPAPSADLRPLPPDDDFDVWGAERDRMEDRSESAQYVSREMTGYEALDGHGRWEDSPDYGPVWIPVGIAPEWAPYRWGRWAYVQPWGWTWIDEQPWGFAPFHYGRWARYRGGWVWAPGVRVVRPVYSPALVAFVGGGGWSVSARFGAGGGVAWFPLAPGEPWVPAYHVSERYARNSSVTYVHVRNVEVRDVDVGRVHYRNAEVEGAVTAVSRETFVGARPMHHDVVVLAPRDVKRVEVVGHAPPVAPRRESWKVTEPTGKAPAAPSPRAAARFGPPHGDPVNKRFAEPMPAARTANVNAEQAAVAEQRALQERHLLEHMQLQQRHQEERAAPAAGVTPDALQARQRSERDAMEKRHATEAATAHATAHATPAPKPVPTAKPTPAPKKNDKPKEAAKPPNR